MLAAVGVAEAVLLLAVGVAVLWLAPVPLPEPYLFFGSPSLSAISFFTAFLRASTLTWRPRSERISDRLALGSGMILCHSDRQLSLLRLGEADLYEYLPV